MSLSTKQYHCQVCNITVNSEDQLNQHNSGSKHKGKAAGNTQASGSGAEQLMSAGMSYFVKEGSAAGFDPSQETPVKAVENTVTSTSKMQSSQDSNTYCSTCRITLTSESQATMHYNGSKHRYKFKLLEEANAGAGGNTAQLPDNPDTFCQTCRVKLTSMSQAQMHYSGAKHKQKQKALEGGDVKLPDGKNGSENSDNSENFCYTCRMNFTSMSQANMHYSGAKHRNKLKLLEETKNMIQSPEDGEPSAKRSKFLEVCETCNVTLTCADMATAHYNGSKHQKKLALLKTLEDGNRAAVVFQHEYKNPQKENNVGGRRPITKFEGTKKEGTLHCSFCDMSINSQAQMDAHQAGAKHKARVNQVASPAPLAPNMMQTMPTSYSMTASQAPFPNSLPPAGAYPQWNNQDPAIPQYHAY